MNYETCLKLCIEALRSEDRSDAQEDIDILLSYPKPTKQEWTDALERARDYGGDSKAFDCLAAYELLLQRRGIQTLLGKVAEGIVKEAAIRANVPEEYLPGVTNPFIARYDKKRALH